MGAILKFQTFNDPVRNVNSILIVIGYQSTESLKPNEQRTPKEGQCDSPQ